MERDRALFERSAGILLHVSSLPSSYGIGSLGEAARMWVDFLHEAGQSFWQILPLGPTIYGDSPYSSPSAFAGNPYFIDLDVLCEEGLLERSEYSDIKWCRSEKRVDYDLIGRHRGSVLRKAFARFKDESALDGFVKQNPWAEDYGLYMAITTTQKQSSWTEWDEPVRTRRSDAISVKRKELEDDVRYHIFVQYQFRRQWDALHDYADSKGVGIIGDIPIYVALDSADVWSSPALFQLDKDSIPTEVSGCPPDSFSADGQVWNTPLYDWETMAKTRYEWWIYRLKHSFELYDVLRIDHFRGLESYFAIPYGAKTAKGGRWKKGPDTDFIDAVKRALPDKRVIAEDLGYLTEDVRKLLTFSGYPSMKLLQFAFDSRVTDSDYRPFTYGSNSVVYPGVHDNDTLKGWTKTASRASIQKAMEYIGIRRVDELPLAMIRLAMQCNSCLAVILMQDWLELGSDARFNTPSTVGGTNWRWRLDKNALTENLAASISKITSLYGRAPYEEGAEDA